MPNKNTAQTGWLIAATEGSTVDGRTITKQWIEEMAETYSIEVYTAVIWPEHFRSSWGPFEGKNWGTVDAVKAAKQGGKLRLFVKLTANQYLLDANKDGQKLFVSIEPNTDFTGTGKCYLQGLAVTDSPASTGITRLKFSMGTNEVEHDYSELEVLQYSDFIFAHREPNQDNQHEQAKNLLTQLINVFSNTKPTNTAAVTPNIAEDKPMTEAQFNALIGKIDGVTTKVEKIESDVNEKFNALNTKVEKFSEPVEESLEVPEEVEAPEVVVENESVSKEQFAQLTTQVTALTTKFTEMSKESDGQEPDPAGQGESISLV